MYTLLPEKQIKGLQKEYHIRIFILFLLCVSGAIWIGIGSLLPSYILSVGQERSAENQVLEIQKSTKAPVNASATAEVAASNANILLVKNAEDNILFSTIIENIVADRISGVSINDIELAHAPVNGNPNQTNIAVRGIASNRDVLVNFEHKLSGDPEFSSVVLPISDLTKSQNIAFSITMTGIH